MERGDDREEKEETSCGWALQWVVSGDATQQQQGYSLGFCFIDAGRAATGGVAST
jgi:hypothetical protein